MLLLMWVAAILAATVHVLIFCMGKPVVGQPRDPKALPAN
jgi:hypothetical protein